MPSTSLERANDVLSTTSQLLHKVEESAEAEKDRMSKMFGEALMRAIAPPEGVTTHSRTLMISSDLFTNKMYSGNKDAQLFEQLNGELATATKSVEECIAFVEHTKNEMDNAKKAILEGLGALLKPEEHKDEVVSKAKLVVPAWVECIKVLWRHVDGVEQTKSLLELRKMELEICSQNIKETFGLADGERTVGIANSIEVMPQWMSRLL